MGKDRTAVSLLDAFCTANDITTPKLADAAEVSRQHMTRVRYAKTDVRLRIAKKIALGASRVVKRQVQVSELFDLDVDYQQNDQSRPGDLCRPSIRNVTQRSASS